MSSAREQSAEHFTILCRRCDRPVLARTTWIGWEVQCPHCNSPMRVPEVSSDRRPVQAEGPDLSAKNCFNFACPRCECLLEAHTGMCGRPANCPTCAARFNVPFLHGRSGRPDRAVLIEGEAEDPTPVHAYGASGHQAPQIVTAADGTSVIECPRCEAYSPIDADICVACGAPFTIEAAATVGKLYRDHWASSSVTLGVVGILLFPTMVPGLLATWLGARSVMFTGSRRRPALGFVGLTLGLLSLAGGIAFWYWKLK
jgi:DNA-directed RNA polymerase subunit RPC12/RpoP